MSDPKVPFVSSALQEAVNQAFSKEIATRVRAKHEQIFDPRNTLEFQHGRRWENPANNLGDKSGEVEQHSFEMSVHMEELLAGNPIVIFQRAELVASEMHNSMERMLFSKLNQSTAQTGNIVNAAEHDSFTEAFAKSLETIEMSVDASGELSMPTIFVAPEQGEAIFKQLKAAGPEYEKRIDEIKERKRQEALKREEERLAKFERRGD